MFCITVFLEGESGDFSVMGNDGQKREGALERKRLLRSAFGNREGIKKGCDFLTGVSAIDIIFLLFWR